MTRQRAHPYVLLLAGIALVLALGVNPGHTVEAAASDPCRSISPRTMSAYRQTIEQALKSAEADARANGTSGAYAIVAVNSRDLLKRSRDRITEAVASLESSDPATTTYAEAGQQKEFVRNTLDWMSEAGHWSLVSVAYHHSDDARDAFERTMRAMDEGLRLFSESGRCFMVAYL